MSLAEGTLVLPGLVWWIPVAIWYFKSYRRKHPCPYSRAYAARDRFLTEAHVRRYHDPMYRITPTVELAA